MIVTKIHVTQDISRWFWVAAYGNRFSSCELSLVEKTTVKTSTQKQLPSDGLDKIKDDIQIKDDSRIYLSWLRIITHSYTRHYNLLSPQLCNAFNLFGGIPASVSKF
jgi:hypothetical protein